MAAPRGWPGYVLSAVWHPLETSNGFSTLKSNQCGHIHRLVELWSYFVNVSFQVLIGISSIFKRRRSSSITRVETTPSAAWPCCPPTRRRPTNCFNACWPSWRPDSPFASTARSAFAAPTRSCPSIPNIALLFWPAFIRNGRLPILTRYWEPRFFSHFVGSCLYPFPWEYLMHHSNGGMLFFAPVLEAAVQEGLQGSGVQSDRSVPSNLAFASESGDLV